MDDDVIVRCAGRRVSSVPGIRFRHPEQMGPDRSGVIQGGIILAGCGLW